MGEYCENTEEQEGTTGNYGAILHHSSNGSTSVRAESWTISKLNMNRLNSFHNRVVRYLTRSHIKKLDDGRWEYPDHEKLREKCKVQEMRTYIERRRKTLRTFLEKERPKLWEEMQNTRAPARDVKKILWWEQPVPVENE